MEKLYYSPLEFEGLSATQAIQAAVDAAHESDIRMVVIPAGTWCLAEPVRLPSHTTVVLDGARVESRGTAFCNLSSQDQSTKSLGGEEHDIILLGKAGAVLAGGVELNNVKDFRIAGLTLEGTVHLVHARFGRLQELIFQNADRAMVLGEGCNSLLVRDIQASTCREAVVLEGGKTTLFGRSPNMYDISVSRLLAATQGAPVVRISSSEPEVYNLFFRDITDLTPAGEPAVVLGEGPELRDISLRGLDSQRRVTVSGSCDGIFLGNLWGPEPEFAQGSTRLLVDPERMEIALPQLSQPLEQAYITPNDPDFYGQTDSQTLQNAVCAAVSQGKKLVIPRYNARTGQLRWDIDRAIRLPSNCTVELWGAHLRQTDYSYDNLFVNEGPENENITVTGLGDALLDSGEPNGLKEKNAGTLGLPDITANALMLFRHVRGLTVENLNIHESRWYGLVCYYCTQGRAADLHLYAPPIFPDLGGIQLRSGCRDFLVEDISGMSGEDMVILGAQALDDDRSDPRGKTPDICDILVRHLLVNSSRCCSLNILAHDGRRISRVVAETFLDCSLPEQKKQPWAAVSLGSVQGYRQAPGGVEDISHITLRDIYSRGGRVVTVAGGASHVKAHNLHGFTSVTVGVETAPGPEVRDFGAAMLRPGRIGTHLRHCEIYGLFFRCIQGSPYMRGTATSIITDKRKFVGMLLRLQDLQAEDLTVREIRAERIGQGVFLTGQAEVDISGVEVAICGRAMAVCGSGCTLRMEGRTVPQTLTRKV